MNEEILWPSYNKVRRKRCLWDVGCCVKGELFKFHFFRITVDAIQNRLELPSPLQDAAININAHCCARSIIFNVN